ncbi:MAG: response regulator [Candidatus Buchananbacteria bacterium]
MLKKSTILVVEDERPLAEAIKAKLERCGLEVVTARTTGQALEFLKAEVKIDVVWLDHYLLGKENGLDLVVAMKQQDSIWKNIPIFVVSNTASPDKVQAYLRLGVNKYYTKADFKLEQICQDVVSSLDQKEE